MSHIDARVERSQALIRDAAVAELTERGWGGFTIDGVAKRAGVARSTVYRHWPDRLHLLVDALEGHSDQGPARAAAPGRKRIVALVRHLAEAMADPARSAITPALIEAAEHDDALRDLQRRFTDRRRQALVDALADDDVADPELVAMALAGAVIYARVMRHHPLSPARATALVDAVLGPARSDR
jgi:AcrR family transcriptional regulator